MSLLTAVGEGKEFEETGARRLDFLVRREKASGRP